MKQSRWIANNLTRSQDSLIARYFEHYNAAMANSAGTEPSGQISQAVPQDSVPKMSQLPLRKLFFISMILSVLNFSSFFLGTFYFGGNAIKGKIDGGRYYLWGYHHGVEGYSEVSPAAFNYSKWHAKSVIITWPFMILGCFIYERIRRQRGTRRS